MTRAKKQEKIEDHVNTEIKAETAIASDFSDLLVSEELKPKRKYTKKEKLESVQIFDDKVLTLLIKFPFDYLANRYGKHWQLTEEEEKSLVTLSNKVASKRLPDWLEKYSDELALSLTLFMVIFPRLQANKKIEQEKKIIENEKSKE